VLAQKDASFYDSFVKLYQLPELVSSDIPVMGEGLAHVIRLPREGLGQIAVTSATVPAGSSGPWQRDVN